MPRFEPFKAVRYAPSAGDPSDLVAPPYDVIGPDDRAALAARSERNAVLLELPDDGHDGAARRYEAWLADGTLVLDGAPALYPYRMTSAAGRATTGVLGALVLEEPGRGILPHERTTAKDKADRLGILRATGVNLSPIWALAPTDGRLAAAIDPSDLELLASAVDEEGTTHELWRLDDPARLAAASEAIGAQPVLIADGHHRFEVAGAHQRDEGAPAGAAAILAYVVELADDELDVHPIHRLLSGLPAGADVLELLAPWFDLATAPVGDPADLPGAMAAAGALGLVTPSGLHLATPKAATLEAAEADLDSSRLDVALAGLPEGASVRFQHGAGIVADAVRRGEADAAVLLRPASVAQIAATSRGGDRMPPKTTFFWPKPRTGLVFRDLGRS